jgi:hypothetical protein
MKNNKCKTESRIPSRQGSASQHSFAAPLPGQQDEILGKHQGLDDAARNLPETWDKVTLLY